MAFRSLLFLVPLLALIWSLVLWLKAEKMSSTRNRILLGFLVLVLSQPVTIVFCVAITQLDDQSYYAASVRILLAEVLDALEENEPGFENRLRDFCLFQPLTYESRGNLLENVRSFHSTGTLIRRGIKGRSKGTDPIKE